jgi:hypothetical protein
MAQMKNRALLPQAPSGETESLGASNTESAPSKPAAQEMRRRQLLEAFSRKAPAWGPAEHPDIEEAGGAAAWVRKLRLEADEASRQRTRPKRG